MGNCAHLATKVLVRSGTDIRKGAQTSQCLQHSHSNGVHPGEGQGSVPTPMFFQL